MKKILILALLFRIIIAFFGSHPDTIDFLGWSKDINKNGLSGIYFRDVDNAGPANYPPLNYLYLNLNSHVYQGTRDILWLINNKVIIFPSNIYLLYESDAGRIWFNKITPIIFDLVLGYFIYLVVKQYKGIDVSKKAAVLYLYFPPSWYISALWGQIDSIYISFFLISIYFLLKKKINLSVTFMSLSLLTKPNAVFLTPLYLAYLLKNYQNKGMVKGILTSFVLFLLPAAYFIRSLNIFSIIGFYIKYVREISGYISSNAFNLWGIFYGFDPIPDSTNLFGIKAFYWGLFMYFLLVAIIIRKFSKKVNEKYLFSLLLLLSYGSFILLTRMHERYFYLTYVLFLILSFLYPKIYRYFIVSAGVFFLNLYHYWWYPYSDALKIFFSTRIVETFLCLTNILIFMRLFFIKYLTQNEK